MTFAPSQCTRNCLTGRLTRPQVRARAGVPALGWAASSLSHHRLHLRPNPPFRHHRPRLAEVDGAELGGEDEEDKEALGRLPLQDGAQLVTALLAELRAVRRPQHAHYVQDAPHHLWVGVGCSVCRLS